MKNHKTLLTFLAFYQLISWSPAFAEDDSEGMSDEAEVKKFVIRFLGGPSIESNDVTGSSGFIANLPNKLGLMYGGELRYRIGASSYTLRARYRHSQASYSGLNGLTPTSISVNRNQINAVFAGNFLAGFGGTFFERLQLGFGCFYGNRSATATSPNEVVTSTKATGGVYYFGYGAPIGTSFDYELDGELIFPFKYSENVQVSGNYQSGLLMEVGLALGYNITEVLEVSVGARYRRENFSFAGTGTRGTVNARDNASSIIIPFDVRFNF